MEKAEIGIIGLGAMGHNLAVNIERNGYIVAVYDRDKKKTEQFLKTEGAGKRIMGAASPAELITLLEKPRRILIMVTSGLPVDNVIHHLKPFMEPGDILIDGGNSFFRDTERRDKELAEDKILYLGMGVSGGPVGARLGPSLMPGGPREAYDTVARILEAIAAKAEDGSPCVTYIGPGGSGHYVKMVHNGIEYAVLQLIAETYDLLHRGIGVSNAELSSIFSRWNKSKLQSYLIQITADILSREDALTGKPMVDIIVDEAEQKGTGEWTAENSLTIGSPAPTINGAVECRLLSALKDQRVQASIGLPGPGSTLSSEREKVIDAEQDALYACNVISYGQGMNMMRCASEEYHYDLNLSEIARIWRGGCIIRARFLDNIMRAYRQKPDLMNLLIDDDSRRLILDSQQSLRFVLQNAISLGIPALAMSVSLAYYDSYRSAILPANLIQAQRDYFGAHTYHRVDKGGVFHTTWTAYE